jgi:3-dehydro-L-gulonate 2-dehydrogenase
MEPEFRIAFTEMKSEFERILLKYGFQKSKAERCAGIFATNSLEGIYSHGVNRFPRFIRYIQEGFIKVDTEPELVHSVVALEQWNGNLGPGPLNAEFCTNRATKLAEKFGIGCVALANSNHWMRAGAYGWLAAKKGFAFIGWTNTMANMPAWGAKNSRLGNNPQVFALPFKDEAIVFDFAMSQFSYGKMEATKIEGKQLPYPGGFNIAGELTTDPGEILDSWRTLPIGYWKGAGLSLMLDIFASILSGGLATHGISKQKDEYGLSQVFIAMNLQKLNNFPTIEKTLNDIITDFKNAVPVSEQNKIRYPGERVVEIRKENLTKGIPVNRNAWEEIKSL